MDCLKAQELVSDALDRELVDAEQLSIAKAHCRDCPQCAAFVRALVAVQRAPLPEPPDGLADRVVGAVRAEHARAERAAAALAATKQAAGPARRPDGGTAPKNLSDLAERLMRPQHRRAVIAWSSAAAVALVAAGFGAIYGTRAILTDRAETQTIVLESAELTQDGVGMTFGNAAAPESADKSRLPSGDASTLPASAGLVIVNGTAYRAAGPDPSVSKESLAERGSTRTALSPDGTVRDRTVLGTDDPARVFIADDEGGMLAFDRITTSFQGRTYALQSGPIGDYGSAAVLPKELTQPLATDGSPTFEPADSAAQNDVFVLRGKDASAGIALPPGARADVAEGWSWWLPTTP